MSCEGDRKVFSLKEKFNAAVQCIRDLPPDGNFKPSSDLMLRFYGLYKQATQGSCSQGRPYAWDIKGRAKWDAWSKLADMGEDEAMQLYVSQLTELFEVMPLDDKTRDLVHVLGPFYEMVFEKSMSMEDSLPEDEKAEIDNEAESESESETFCDTSNVVQFEVLHKPIGTGALNFAERDLGVMQKRLDSLHLSMDKAVDLISKLSMKLDAVEKIVTDKSSKEYPGCFNSICFKLSRFLISKPSLFICIIFIWPLMAPFILSRLAKLFYKRNRSIAI